MALPVVAVLERVDIKAFTGVEEVGVTANDREHGEGREGGFHSVAAGWIVHHARVHSVNGRHAVPGGGKIRRIQRLVQNLAEEQISVSRDGRNARLPFECRSSKNCVARDGERLAKG